MRSFIVSVALGLGVLGFLGATPSEAKAYWPPNMGNGYQIGPYANYNSYVGTPFYRYSAGPYSYNLTYGNPGYIRRYSTPMGFGATYMSPSYSGTAYSPFYGMYNYYATPGYMSYSFSPYSGYRTIVAPGMNYVVPSGYSSGYVPMGYGY
jgi:hypothetical protein